MKNETKIDALRDAWESILVAQNVVAPFFDGTNLSITEQRLLDAQTVLDRVGYEVARFLKLPLED